MGNGYSINFWKDPWLFEKPLNCMFNNPQDISICSSTFGPRVKDYWRNNCCVKLALINPVFHEIDKALLAQCCYADKEDTLIWGPLSSGKFYVASASSIQFDVPKETPFWVKIWNKNLTLKVEIFYWIFVQNKVLTIDNLRKRGFIMPNRCCLCQEAKEDTNHLFLHCPFSQ